jgi:hypothetical protein
LIELRARLVELRRRIGRLRRLHNLQLDGLQRWADNLGRRLEGRL